MESMAIGETHEKHSVVEPTSFKCESRFLGMTVPYLTQLRARQDENAWLTRKSANLFLWAIQNAAVASSYRCKVCVDGGEYDLHCVQSDGDN